ncbi:unnamed protein product [Strongylus vulgaris]|uniref:Uncharacterized protein n=1 Tax=Strongylus vulgaris TaxID=40348 RepID=A0A3P7JAF5_STRVU|nr:unnamed protein product [Strongylus vulgaris]
MKFDADGCNTSFIGALSLTNSVRSHFFAVSDLSATTTCRMTTIQFSEQSDRAVASSLFRRQRSLLSNFGNTDPGWPTQRISLALCQNTTHCDPCSAQKFGAAWRGNIGVFRAHVYLVGCIEMKWVE